MARTGEQYLESLRDGRVVYIDGELVDDVTTHPAFEGVGKSVARMYDFAADPKNNMTYTTEDGTEANVAFMIPRSREDLQRRREALTKWGNLTLGFIGRSPDHIASYMAGFASHPEVFARGGERYKENLLNFYKFARDNDQFITYTIMPPQIDRSKPSHEQPEPFLAAGVVKERDDGIIVRGAQMLGTSTAVSNYLYSTCIRPMVPGEEDYALSFVLPVNTPGLKLFCRPAYASGKSSVYDYPLSTQFDESDALVVFDDVFVPWENIFVYRDVELIRAHIFETPAHVFGNWQAQIRFVSKLKFILGMAKKITQMLGTDKIPSVIDKLGTLSSLAAAVEAMVLASEYNCIIDENGVARPNPRFMYGSMGIQGELHSKMIQIFRELPGGGVLQLPSTYKEMFMEETKGDIYRYIRTKDYGTEEKIKLFRLAWDLIGSEFAGRHQQYEMFYIGPSYVAKGYSYRNYGHDEVMKLVDEFMATYDLPK